MKVAIAIPIAPQTIDVTAPMTKAKAVYADLPLYTAPKIIKNIMKTNIKQIVYYCLRNSFAP